MQYYIRIDNIDNIFYPELIQPLRMVCYPKAVNVHSSEGQKGCKSLSCCFSQKFGDWVHPQKLTWNPKIGGLEMFLLFQGDIFRFHVSFRGCNISYSSG